MRNVFKFGEQVEGYDMPVLNVRAVRVSVVILFFQAIIVFMNAWLLGNFQPSRVFVVAFLLDFSIRIFINSRYAPSLIVGQWFVRKQQPDYVGAPQKCFAWATGFVLVLNMWYLVVLNNVIGPINLIVCSACLTLLFFESAFGICIGCKIYNLFNKEKARLCPGGACEVPPGKWPQVSIPQAVIVVLFAAVVVVIAQWVYSTAPQNLHQVLQPNTTAAINPAEAEGCKVADFAKALGHEEKWKLHNYCK